MSKNPRTQSGFTLTELLVSIGIFSVITVMAVFNNAQFNSSVLLTNLAYDVGLSIRQAQVYGVTVRRNAASGFTSGYGVHFGVESPTSYFIFEDVTRNHRYDPITDPILETFTLTKGNSIGRICVAAGCDFGDLDISFERPNPDAFISLNNDGFIYSSAQLCVSSPQGTIRRKIVIGQSGQISVSVDTAGTCDTTTGFYGGYESSYEGGYESGYVNSYEGGYESSYEGGYESSYEGGYESSYEGGYEGGYGGGDGGDGGNQN